MIKVLLYEKCLYIRKHLAVELCNDAQVEIVASCEDDEKLLKLSDILEVDVVLITTAHPCYKRLTRILSAEYPSTRIVGIPRKGNNVNPTCIVNIGSSSYVCNIEAHAKEIIDDIVFVHSY